MNKYEGAKDVLAGEDTKKPPKVLHEIRMRKGHGGKGRIVEHHHTLPSHHPMEEHIMGNMKEALAHMNEHMGDPDEKEPMSEASSEAMPSVVASSEAGGQ